MGSSWARRSPPLPGPLFIPGPRGRTLTPPSPGTGQCWTMRCGKPPLARVCVCVCWSAAGWARTPPCSPTCDPCRRSATPLLASQWTWSGFAPRGGGRPFPPSLPSPTHAPSLFPKKVFIVPVGNHSNIPFSRVNHNKFMVTEKAAYIGGQRGHPGTVEAARVSSGPGICPGAGREIRSCRTQDAHPRGTWWSSCPRPGWTDSRAASVPPTPNYSWGHVQGRWQGLSPAPILSFWPSSPGTSNWSEDYFSSTSGVGLVVSQRAPGAQAGVQPAQDQLRQLFERDWGSPYAVGLDGQAPGQDCVWQG